MVFSSLVFLFLFLPGTIAIYFALPWRSLRNIFLLAASLIFYAWGEPRYVLLIIFSIIVNWALALAISRFRHAGLSFLWAGVTANLAAISIFKYLGFFAENINFLGAGFAIPQVVLPIGISFYTFQAISYLVDVHRGEVQPQRNPLFFGAYLSMFPQLIAGPIVRYKTIEHELVNRRENLHDFAQGLRRFGIGLAKKVLIANPMGAMTDAILEAGPAVGALPAWTAFIAYSFQIYFDFSAYSDMAIGLGRMFGFHFLENFNYPYISRSVTEFWRRWHISLSSFFRDYIYIPLGGNRVTSRRWVLNLLIVWSLTGLWHGASWNFVFWGLYYGVLLGLEKLLLSPVLTRLPRMLQHLYVILIFLGGWVLFRLETLQDIRAWTFALLGANGLGHPAVLSALNVLHFYPWIFVAAVGSTPLLAHWLRSAQAHPRKAWLADLYILFVVAWSIIELVLGGFNPFIYYRF